MTAPAMMNEPATGPAAVLAFAADIKLSHSVFALPFAMLSATLAALSPASVFGQTWGYASFGLILVCMVAARTAAMGANRYLDANLDAQNPRTRSRAIPAGRVSGRFVLTTTLASGAIFLLGCVGFGVFYGNWLPALLGLPVLAFICGYPLLKRFSSLCHYYLGAALALAPICAWIAVSGTLAVEPLLMAGSVLCWTAGFDVIYATADRDSDIATGVHSMPARLGIAKSLYVSRATHVVSAALLVLLGFASPQLGMLWFLAVAVTVVLLIIEHIIVRPDDLSRVGMAFFTVNGIISLLLGTAGIVDALT